MMEQMSKQNKNIDDLINSSKEMKIEDSLLNDEELISVLKSKKQIKLPQTKGYTMGVLSGIIGIIALIGSFFFFQDKEYSSELVEIVNKTELIQSEGIEKSDNSLILHDKQEKSDKSLILHDKKANKKNDEKSKELKSEEHETISETKENNGTNSGVLKFSSGTLKFNGNGIKNSALRINSGTITRISLKKADIEEVDNKYIIEKLKNQDLSNYIILKPSEFRRLNIHNTNDGIKIPGKRLSGERLDLVTKYFIKDTTYRNNKNYTPLSLTILNDDGISFRHNYIFNESDLFSDTLAPDMILGESYKFFNGKWSRYKNIVADTIMGDGDELLDTDLNLYYNVKNESVSFSDSYIIVFLESGSIDSSYNNARYTRVFMLFPPTNDVISRLPDRYRIPLEAEIQLKRDYENGVLKKEEFCENLQETSLLGFCGQHNGNLTFNKLYPSPNEIDQITSEVDVAKPCKLKVSIHDISGRLITTAIESYSASKGINKITLMFNGKIKKGYYVLIIESDLGDRVFMNFLKIAK